MGDESVKTARSAPVSIDAKRSIDPPPKAVWIAGAVLAAIGIVAFGVQMAGQSMAGSSQYPWGMYIALFYTAASAGAGTLIVSGIARQAGFLDAAASRVLYAAAVALFVVASILITVDLGNPLAILLTYTSPNPTSPVLFDAIVLPACIVLCVLAALFSSASEAAGRAFALAGVVAGFVLLGVEAWLLTTCSGRDAWGVLLGAGPALIQAVTLGLALVMLVAPARRGWRALLAAAVLVMIVSLVFDALLNQDTGTVLGRQLGAVVASPLFWVAAVVGIAAVVLLAVPNVSESAMKQAAAVCAIASAALFKLAIIWATQSVVAVSELEAAGAAPFDAVEVLVFLGAAGIGVLVYAIALQILSRRSMTTASTTFDTQEV